MTRVYWKDLEGGHGASEGPVFAFVKGRKAVVARSGMLCSEDLYESCNMPRRGGCGT